MSAAAAPPRPLLREAARKCFHLLSLVYLAAYHALGMPAAAWALGAWTAAVLALELSRLNFPKLQRFLIGIFGGIIRPEEMTKVSAIVHTSTGSLATVLLFGDSPQVVTAAMLCLALGDAAAALVGRAWGTVKFKVWGRLRTLEGTAACFAACLWGVSYAGFEGPALWAAAVAAALTETLAPWPDDNFWLPLSAAAALVLFT